MTPLTAHTSETSIDTFVQLVSTPALFRLNRSCEIAGSSELSGFKNRERR